MATSGDATFGDELRGGSVGGAAGPGERGDVRCKLLRGDGSEWTVTGLSLARDGLHVSAYRYVRDPGDPAESRREEMDDELLGHDDRVWCLDRRGSVVWTLSSPDGPQGPADALPGRPGADDG